MRCFLILAFWRLLLLAALALAGCVVALPPNGPRPPRGKYSLEKAKRWVERNNTPQMQNRRYYPAYPR